MIIITVTREDGTETAIPFTSNNRVGVGYEDKTKIYEKSFAVPDTPTINRKVWSWHPVCTCTETPDQVAALVKAAVIEQDKALRTHCALESEILTSEPAPMVSDYAILTSGGTHTLESRIRANLAAGFQPYGAPYSIMTTLGQEVIRVPMVRYADTKRGEPDDGGE